MTDTITTPTSEKQYRSKTTVRDLKVLYHYSMS